tara:strand:+ start:2890 stop:3066 length:177 start_codon:yes stop_codon:yes gene_type:complete
MNENIIPLEKKDKRIIISISEVNKEKFVCEAQRRGLSLTNFFTFSVLKEINGGDFQND